MALRDRNQLALEEIERRKQDVITNGAAAGKTISTEAALKHVLELKTKCTVKEIEARFGPV